MPSPSGRDLLRAHGMALHDKVRSCEIPKALDVLDTSANRETPARLVRRCVGMSQKRWARQVLLATSTGKRPRCRPKTRWSDYISDLARFRLGVEPADLSEIADDREVFRVLLGLLLPQPSPEEKQTWKWMNRISQKKFSGFCIKGSPSAVSNHRPCNCSSPT